MSGGKDSACDAFLDPWCIVPMTDGTKILFGFALIHAKTGGLSWMSSSELLQLDLQAGSAVTYSRRHYRLGRRFEAVDVGAEGDEARWAFELLVFAGYEDAEKLRRVDKLWLTVGKAARHLKLERPPRTGPAIEAFFDRHGAAFEVARAAARRRS
jgi:hypothetical protein